MADDLYSIGQLPLSAIYHELEIDQFVKNRHRNWGTAIQESYRHSLADLQLCPAEHFL